MATTMRARREPSLAGWRGRSTTRTSGEPSCDAVRLEQLLVDAVEEASSNVLVVDGRGQSVPDRRGRRGVMASLLRAPAREQERCQVRVSP